MYLESSPHYYVNVKKKIQSRVTLFPVNASNAITGHKLKVMKKDELIVYSWIKSQI